MRGVFYRGWILLVFAMGVTLGMRRMTVSQQPDLPAYAETRSYNVCSRRSTEMALYHQGDFVSNAIRHSGMFEGKLICSMIDHMAAAPAGSVFVDVGANIGAWTVALASVAPGIPVVAVEPMPNNIQLLRWTLYRNNLKSVTLVHRALSERIGVHMCMWETDATNRGNARLVPYFEGVKDFGEDKGKTCDVRVQVNTLDNVIANTIGPNTRIWGMKLDIEGYETMAMRGGQNTLLTNRPCKIWFEYQRAVTRASGAMSTELFKLLSEHGYTIYDTARNTEVKGPLFFSADIFDAVAVLPECNKGLLYIYSKNT